MDSAKILHAVEQGLRIEAIGGEAYAADPFHGPDGRLVGHWVWKLEGDSEVHFVSSEYCTCDGFRRMGRCKHHSHFRVGACRPNQRGER